MGEPYVFHLERLRIECIFDDASRAARVTRVDWGVPPPGARWGEKQATRGKGEVAAGAAGADAAPAAAAATAAAAVGEGGGSRTTAAAAEAEATAAEE